MAKWVRCLSPFSQRRFGSDIHKNGWVCLLAVCLLARVSPYIWFWLFVLLIVLFVLFPFEIRPFVLLVLLPTLPVRRIGLRWCTGEDVTVKIAPLRPFYFSAFKILYRHITRCIISRMFSTSSRRLITGIYWFGYIELVRLSVFLNHSATSSRHLATVTTTRWSVFSFCLLLFVV